MGFLNTMNNQSHSQIHLKKNMTLKCVIKLLKENKLSELKILTLGTKWTF